MLLQLEDVTKTYAVRGRPVTGLSGAFFEVAAGEFVSVVGPSGSGKSTLLLTGGGMLTPESGRVLLEGKSLYDLCPDERARLRLLQVGFIFQTFNLIPYLTAQENVQLPLLLQGECTKTQEKRSREVLDRVGLADRFDHKPSELSVGQQQRVAIARVLVNDPALVLADEPTGNLDPETGGEILALLEGMHQEGKTIVMVTHDPVAAARAQRTVRLREGKLIAAKEGQGSQEASLRHSGGASSR